YVAIVDIQPELIEPERRCSLRIEPDGPRFSFAEFRSRRGLHQRPDQAVGFRRAKLSNEIDARRNVAPLIAAAQLQDAAVAIEQLKKIVRLQDQIAELGEGNAVLAFQATADGFLLQHVVHSEMLARLAEKREQIDGAQP